MTCSQRQWLHSSVGRASHRYREVTGSNPVEVLNFFQASLRNCLNCVSLRRSYLHFISFPQFIYDSFHISLTVSVIFKIHVCLHCAMSWPVSNFCLVRREWVGLVCCHFPSNPLPDSGSQALKAVFVTRGLQIQRLTVENSPSISGRTRLSLVMFKLRTKNTVQHQKRPSQVLYYLCHCFRCIDHKK